MSVNFDHKELLLHLGYRFTIKMFAVCMQRKPLSSPPHQLFNLNLVQVKVLFMDIIKMGVLGAIVHMDFTYIHINGSQHAK